MTGQGVRNYGTITALLSIPTDKSTHGLPLTGIQNYRSNGCCIRRILVVQPASRFAFALS